MDLDRCPEAREVLAKMLPTGHNLREVIDRYFSAGVQETDPPYYALNRLPVLQMLEIEEAPAQTRSGEVLEYIRRLAKRAWNKDEDATIALALIALDATLRLHWLSWESDTIKKLAPHMPLWPIIWSPITTLGTTDALFEKINLGADFVTARGTESRRLEKKEEDEEGKMEKKAEGGKKEEWKFKWSDPTGKRGARPKIDSKATLFAAAAACYMFGVRAGISTSVRLKWAKKVHQLPPLTEETTGQWWPLAREEIDECYPDLRHVFFPKGSLQISVRRKDAWNAIEEAFRHTWKMFS